MTGHHLAAWAAAIVLALWSAAVCFAWLKFRTAIFGGRARHLYRAHQREGRMMAAAFHTLDEYAEPYGDASTYMIGERNG
jgi:hypothetical protein